MIKINERDHNQSPGIPNHIYIYKSGLNRKYWPDHVVITLWYQTTVSTDGIGLYIDNSLWTMSDNKAPPPPPPVYSAQGPQGHGYGQPPPPPPGYCKYLFWLINAEKSC